MSASERHRPEAGSGIHPLRSLGATEANRRAFCPNLSDGMSSSQTVTCSWRTTRRGSEISVSGDGAGCIDIAALCLANLIGNVADIDEAPGIKLRVADRHPDVGPGATASRGSGPLLRRRRLSPVRRRTWMVYPYLWSWGGKEVEADGKTVVLDSKETLELVKFAVPLWKETMDEGGLAWDDTNNNRAFLSGTISATNNGASIYLEAKKKPDTYKTEKGKPMKDDILHASIPGGSGGQFNLPGPLPTW